MSEKNPKLNRSIQNPSSQPFSNPNNITQKIITIIYPDEHLHSNDKLFLRGDNCDLTWNQGIILEKGQPNTWTTHLMCPIGENVNVKVLVNDIRWMSGTNFFFHSSISDPILIFPCFNPTVLPVSTFTYLHSLSNSHKISIYYPPSYYQNPYKKYQLLIMQDGQNLFDHNTATYGRSWECHETANKLIFQGRIKQIVIVGIWSNEDRISEYTESFDTNYQEGGNADTYLNFIEQQLIPELNKNYLKDRIIQNEISIGGSSLGGLLSCYALCTRPKTYKKAICMSPSFWWNSSNFSHTILQNHDYNPITKIYLDCGDSGEDQLCLESTLQVQQILISKGYQSQTNLFFHMEQGGEHKEEYWGARFETALIKLFK